MCEDDAMRLMVLGCYYKSLLMVLLLEKFQSKVFFLDAEQMDRILLKRHCEVPKKQLAP
jgi:hypothetical protein